MTHDLTHFDETEPIGDTSSPPLCLVHYFVESLAYPPERNPKPPGRQAVGRIAERRGNLIILEFAPPPEPTKTKLQIRRQAQRLLAKAYNALFLLLLLSSLVACIAAFRF